MSDLTRDDIILRMEECHVRMEELAAKHRMSRADEEEFDELKDEFDGLNEHRERLERAAKLTNPGAHGYRLERGSPGDDDDRPQAGHQRDAAARTLDRHVSAGTLAARGAELVDTLMRTGSAPTQSWTQRWAVAAGDSAYERAFCKLVADPTRGHLTWTPDEGDAYRRVATLQTEQRAMSLSDSAGGYMVPLTLDPAIMLTSDGSTNPLRQISRVVQTVSDTWQGVTSAGVSAEWIAEAGEVADASPTLGGPSIPVHKADAFVPFSFELAGDAVGFMTELGKLLTDAADQLTATAYTTGSGTGQPKGVITGVAAETDSVVDPATAETLAAGDVYAVQNALPPRFQPRAAWNANLSVLNSLRQLETTNGALKFPELATNPPRLLGRSVYENSNMDGSIDGTATADNYVLLYGDFAAGFVIVDRIGSTLELVPHLFGENRRPTGQRGALLWFRTGSDVVVPQAFRVLNVATTA